MSGPPPPTLEQYEQAELRSLTKWQPTLSVLSALSTVLMAVFTGFLVYFTHRYTDYASKQWEAMEASLKKTEQIINLTKQQLELAAASANASQRSAGAAEQSARISTQALEKGDRAYVDIFDQRLVGGLVPGQKLTVSLHFRNVGRTAAKNFTGKSIIERSPRPSPQIPTKITPDEKASRTMLPSGAQIEAQTSTLDELSPPEVELIKQGRRWLYVFGTEFFDDVYGKHHWLEFCVIYRPEPSRFDFCAMHNRSD